MPKTVSQKVVRDPEFAKRLAQAVAAHPRSPDVEHGRQAWLQRELTSRFDTEFSKEAVRRWFAGEMKPRPDTLENIAEALGVDVAWLSLGISPEIAPKERKLRNAQADGAVNLIAGLIQMQGGHPAFPPEADADRYDLSAVIRGALYHFRVGLAQEMDDGSLKFTVPNNAAGVVNLGVIPRNGMHVDVIEITPELIDKHGARKGPISEVEIEDAGRGKYVAGKDGVKTISSFTDRV